jgi:phosphoglycerol geranylgeranyltransferase
MNFDWDRISHITKVDPAEDLPSDLDIVERTDLVIVGGSDGVTNENTLDVVRRIRTQCPEMTIFQEPYSSSHVSSATIDAVDFLSIPAVYNGDHDHFVEKHIDLFTEVSSKPEEALGSGLPIVGDLISSKGRDVISEISDRIIGEGYVIQHLDSKAAEMAGVDTLYTTEQVAGAALATESFYGFPIFYIEYSGTYGGPADVEAASKYLNETVLLYGGGIKSDRQTNEILAAGADAVVVGDCFHDDPDQYLQTIPR